MRLRSSCLALLFLVTAAAAALAEAPPSEPPAFEVVKVAEGVHAVLRKEPPGLMFDANVVFLINEEDVMVVDSNVGPASAGETIAALRRLTSKPVRYVVNTHWHDDHLLGNHTYLQAFPDVEFIAHTSAREDMVRVGGANRHQMVQGAPPFLQRIKSQMAQGLNLSGDPLTEEERASFESDIRLVERFLAEAPGFRMVRPTIEVEEKVAFRRGNRVIEIRHLGKGHTAADLVVWLPEDGIAVTGDLVVWPVPLVGSTSSPAAYLETLQSLVALRPRVIVPGHGPVLRDLSYVQLLIRLLTSLTQQVEAAVERGETLEQARKSVDLGLFRQEIAGDSPVRHLLFDTYVTASGVAAAYREATEER